LRIAPRFAVSGSVADPQDILERKRDLRAQMKAVRATLSPARMAQAADALAGQGLAFLPTLAPSTVVSGFASMPDELRAWPLLRRLHRDRHPLCLPVIQGKGTPLIFRAWAPGDAMNQAVWGISEPKADKAQLEPDVLLVPLLAFDAAGWRLGYGGGYYDRTLRGLRARKRIVAVGLAYDEQHIDAVPHLDYDERLDWVLTPSGPIRCASEPNAPAVPG
jgi:5-formyltetrahydrofolate cyclo-ligase